MSSLGLILADFGLGDHEHVSLENLEVPVQQDSLVLGYIASDAAQKALDILQAFRHIRVLAQRLLVLVFIEIDQLYNKVLRHIGIVGDEEGGADEPDCPELPEALDQC